MRRLTVLYLPPLLAFPTSVRIIYIDEFCFVKSLVIATLSALALDLLLEVTQMGEDQL